MKAAFVPQAYAGRLGSCDQEKEHALLFSETLKSSLSCSLLICCFAHVLAADSDGSDVACASVFCAYQ